MKQNLSELYCKDSKKACQLALRRTAGLGQDRMEKINELLGLYGVEAIRGEWQNGYWCDIVAVYCNTGDTYDLTVIEQRPECSFGHSTFSVESVGDFIERKERSGVQFA